MLSSLRTAAAERQISRNISLPVKTLTRGAGTVARGRLTDLIGVAGGLLDSVYEVTHNLCGEIVGRWRLLQLQPGRDGRSRGGARAGN